MSEIYRVVSPMGIPAAKEKNVAPSLPDLNGKIIGELWNGGFRGDETFPIIEEAIREIYPDVKFVDHTVFGNFHDPSNEAQKMAALPGELKAAHVDAVIIGNGC
ncbi:hypothetical protein [Clostridium fessum]|uniref:hypothetical protein n=1 Tax=Clostridium fessum TaxID=2126740 RepID=UPI002A829C55|nr:hypothetical protein [Clostridium fessum]MDY4928131.1 hypothetical protein [Clostridium fessum]